MDFTAGRASAPKAARRIRVALVNDFELILRGLQAMLEPYRDRIEVLELDVGVEPDQPIDIALLDLYGQRHGGLGRVHALTSSDTAHVVAVYAWQLTAAEVRAVLAAGAQGVLDKAAPTQQLVEDLLKLDAGETVVSESFGDPTGTGWPGQRFGLSARESEVASLLLLGLSNREIAEALYISEHTVKTHLKGIFKKTGTATRGQAVARIAGDREFSRRTVG